MSEADDEFDPVQFRRDVSENASALVARYHELRPTWNMGHGLQETLAYEQSRLTELRATYAPHLASVRCLKGRYFEDFDQFLVHQDVPEDYLIPLPPDYYFISHRWEARDCPDPSARQFEAIRAKYHRLKPSVQDSYGFWYDYSCIPQRDADGKRSKEDERAFQENLQVMHLLPMLSSNLSLFTAGYVQRSWCCSEWMFATKVSPLPLEADALIPFRNDVKFRHLGLLTWFLRSDEKSKAAFAGGDDGGVMASLNTLLFKTLQLTQATYADDKVFLASTAHRHFWYHLRLAGLRTHFMIACLLFDRLPPEAQVHCFQTFLALSGDARLDWISRPTFDLDTMILNLGDPFRGLVFHKGNIEVRSRSQTP